MEYTASFKASRQISMDDWDIYHPSLKITDDTTMREIKEWYDSTKEGFPRFEIRISQLDTLTK